MGKEYNSSPQYDYNEAVLESFNISNKIDYLNLIHYFYSLVDLKCSELTKSIEHHVQYFRFDRNIKIYDSIVSRICNNSSQYFRKSPNDLTHISNEIYDYVEYKFNNLNSNSMQMFICTLSLNGNCSYKSIKETSVVQNWLFGPYLRKLGKFT